MRVRGHLMRIRHSKIDPVSWKRAILINICTINLKSTVSTQEVHHLQVNTVSWLYQQIIASCLHNWVPAESFPQRFAPPPQICPLSSDASTSKIKQVLLRDKRFSTCQASDYNNPVLKPLDIFFGRLCHDKRFIMKLAHAVILSGILLNYILIAFCCSPPDGWLPLRPRARVKKADIVIYGTVRASRRRGPKKDHEGLYSALFEVHCTLKGGIVPQFINVSGFGFAGGLCTNSAAYLNRTYIAFIRRDVGTQENNTAFFADEVNVQSATIPIKHKVSKAVLKDIVDMVGKNATLPLGATKDSLPGCPTGSPQPLFHPTAITSGTEKIICHPVSRKHKSRRRRKKCHVVTSPSSTQMSRTTTKLSSRLSDKRTKSSLLTTTVFRHRNVDFLLHNHSTRCGGCWTSNICWCFVLIFHGLVLVVVKWHQTWFMALLRQGKQIATQSDESALWLMIAWDLKRANFARFSVFGWISVQLAIELYTIVVQLSITHYFMQTRYFKWSGICDTV